MKIVIDTNILLVCISDRSPYHLIFKSFIEQKFDLCVTTEILNEYAEIFARYSSSYLAKYALSVIENAPNVDYVSRYFAFELIQIDLDDRNDGPQQVCGLCHSCKCRLYCISRQTLQCFEGYSFPQSQSHWH